MVPLSNVGNGLERKFITFDFIANCDYQRLVFGVSKSRNGSFVQGTIIVLRLLLNKNKYKKISRSNVNMYIESPIQCIIINLDSNL